MPDAEDDQVIDGDGHIFEWERTFADEFLDPAFHHRRPVVVDGPQQLHWLIDNLTLPGLYGASRRRVPGRARVAGRRPARHPSSRRRSRSGSSSCRDQDERLALHRAEGIDAAVIYPTLFLFRPLSSRPGVRSRAVPVLQQLDGRRVPRLERRARMGRGHRLPRSRRGRGRDRRAKGLGAVGVMAPGMVDTESIAAPRYEPIWAAAEEHDLAVGVHVAYCTPLDTFGFVYSVLMGFEQVVASGLLDRYPRLRVAFLEASCNWVPFMIERLEEKANPERRRFKPDRPLDTILDRPEQGGYLAELSPVEYIERGNIYLGFEVEDPLLPYCIEHFGEDCWVFGSDIPHGDRLENAAKVLLARTDIPADVTRKMVSTNVRRFYGLG